MTVGCQKPGCGKTWPRDPILEVACPTCHANIGTRCKRPSGHTAWGEGDFHRERDIAADQGGHYGPCPLGLCGLDNIQKRKDREAMPLFAEIIG